MSPEKSKSLFDEMRRAAEQAAAEQEPPAIEYIAVELPRISERPKARRQKKQKRLPRTDYYSELTHPLWQKKRLEVFNRGDFICEDCKSNSNTLTVHHCYYEYGIKPWEYDSDTMLGLCWNCHQPRQLLDRKAKRLFGKVLGSIKTSKETEKLINHPVQLVDNGRWK